MFTPNYCSSFTYLKRNNIAINLVKINQNINKYPCKNHNNNCSRETENIIILLIFCTVC